ncbi:MAG: nicotinate (nicotinamide) nucleotide adenylyltransferase [Bacteroidales bacterium]|nr:nicotinate (nicotinamide) nucleotide adenylyltransferase [Bacteroidales bacterium]
MCFKAFRRKRRVALFFGSFNPMHNGHLAILRYLKEHTRADEVRIVVSPESPFKAGNAVSAEERLDNVRKVVAASGLNVIVSDVEFHLEPPLYTINTLRYLQRTEPDCRHIMVIGGDNLASLERWKCGPEILEEFEVWVYPREGYDSHELLKDIKNRRKVRRIRILDKAQLYDISSTMIREGEAKGLDMSSYKPTV